MLVSFIIPCLNEEKAIGKVIEEIHPTSSLRDFAGHESKKFNKEIIVVDNGSTDKTAKFAQKAGAKVVIEPRKGYGRALLAGLSKARGDFLVFADGDGSYDFGESGKLIKELIKGNDIVIGNRLSGKMQKNAMPFWHRYVGTPLLNFLLNLFNQTSVNDVNSGFRALTKKAFKELKLKSSGMEFASEMLYKAAHRHLKIAQVSITYRPSIGESKLSPIRDAWRHLKSLLLFSPTFLFIIPGMVLIILGLAILLWLLPGKQFLLGRFFDIHTMTVASFLVIVGFQALFLGMFAKVFALNYLDEPDLTTQKLVGIITLEKGLGAGALVCLGGLAGLGWVLYVWLANGFGSLGQERLLLFSVTLLTLGILTIFASFFFAILGKEERWV